MIEAAAFRGALAVIAIHLVADGVVALEPGISVGDHWAAMAIPVALLLAAAWSYPRLRPGVGAGLALALGLFALVGAGVSVAAAAIEGIDAVDLTGFLLLPAGLLLLIVGARTLWRSRRPEGRRYLRRGLLALGALAAGYWVVLPIGFAWVATHRPASAPEAADLGQPHESVTIATEDGLDLAGWYVPSRNGAAVITYPSREGSVAEARMLAARGFGVLALDMRGYGESDGDPNAFGWGAQPDLDAAVAYVSSRPEVTGGVGGLGLSVGGEQMLEAAAGNPGLSGVVSEGAGERSIRETLLFGAAAAATIPHQAVLTAAVAVFSGDPPPRALDDAASEISPRATFLIYGEEGQPGEELNLEYFDAAGDPKEIWEVPDAGHTGGLDAQPTEYARRVTEFFERHLDASR